MTEQNGVGRSATEVLRAMLDERGVEWSSPSGLNKSFADSITFIGDVAVVSEIDGSDLLRINFDGTPEQAIAATLGRETARRVTVTMDERGTIGHTECSACGAAVGMDDKFCRMCGREFV